jgi:hypothetical protein
LIVCLLLWLWAAGASWLVGEAALRLASRGFPGPRPPRSVTVLFGLCCIAVLGGFWSLAAPLNGWAAAAGLAVLAASASIVVFVPPRAPRIARCSLAEGALAGLVAIVAVAQTASPASVVDTGLYHLQAIRWIQQYPVVPGLANLHDRLAFSAPWFEAQALFDPVLLGGQPALALNGMVFVMALAFFHGGLDRSGDHLPLTRLLRLGCVPAAFWLLRRGLSSASPDIPAALLSWVALLLLVEKVESGTGAALDLAAWVAAGLASFAAVTKLSAAPLLLAPAWLVVCKWRQDRGRALAVAALAAVVDAPFVIRSVIESGYLLFPVPWTQVPGLSWTVPPANVAGELARIGDWARLPNRPHVSAWRITEWLPAWVDHLTPVERLILGSLPVLAGASFVSMLRRKPGGATGWPAGYAWLVGLTVLGTVLWLVTAPDPRFGWAFFPFLALLLAAPLARRWIGCPPRWLATLLLAAVLLDQGRRVIGQEGAALRGHWLWPVPPPAVATRSVALGSLAIRLPVAGGQCWDAPLPCAPWLDPELAPRGASIAEGFYLQRPQRSANR